MECTHDGCKFCQLLEPIYNLDIPIPDYTKISDIRFVTLMNKYGTNIASFIKRILYKDETYYTLFLSFVLIHDTNLDDANIKFIDFDRDIGQTMFMSNDHLCIIAGTQYIVYDIRPVIPTLVYNAKYPLISSWHKIILRDKIIYDGSIISFDSDSNKLVFEDLPKHRLQLFRDIIYTSEKDIALSFIAFVGDYILAKNAYGYNYYKINIKSLFDNIERSPAGNYIVVGIDKCKPIPIPIISYDNPRLKFYD